MKLLKKKTYLFFLNSLCRCFEHTDCGPHENQRKKKIALAHYLEMSSYLKISGKNKQWQVSCIGSSVHEINKSGEVTLIWSRPAHIFQMLSSQF
jgi:hypothetical protein